MTLITHTNPYSSGNLYQPAGEKVTESSLKSDTAKDKESKTAAPAQGVRVTLSPAVERARLRESMGLPPTGRMTLKNFEDAAQSREKIVADTLKDAMKDLGIDEKIKFSLSLDGKSGVSIPESFPGKSALVKVLNKDDAFKQAFKQLSASQQVVDYTQNLSQSQTSLMDYMDTDAGWEKLTGLATQYSEVKAAGRSLTSLLGISRAQAPYTYFHNPGES